MSAPLTNRFRRGTVYFLFFAVGAGLVWRLVDLQVMDQGFLQGQGDARHQRVVKMPAYRGAISDRHGEPLALSAPVDSIWAVPRETLADANRLAGLSKTLGVSKERLLRRLKNGGREFVYLRRHMIPDHAARVVDLNVDGVHRQREYRRYYPSGEVAGHLVGFTDVDNAGQEGIELAFEQTLQGQAGKRRVVRDRYGRVIESAGVIEVPHPGKDLRLTIDRRIQYIAYRELKRAVLEKGARGGSAMIVDVRNGEILAAVNQPAYNPNNRAGMKPNTMRNRVFTDMLEPGSTMKPFTVLTALNSGRYQPGTAISTGPGWIKVGGGMVKDLENLGTINVSKVITKSSNVGASKLVLAHDPQDFHKTLTGVGFGQKTAVNFPGESVGRVRHHSKWRTFERATLSFGYGMTTTVAQLAQAYTVLAADGRFTPLSLIMKDADSEPGKQVFASKYVRQVRRMMETVVSAEGTALTASIPGYRVAGKTGTVHKAEKGGYAKNRFRALFAGMVPARNPRLVMVVMIDEPPKGVHYGGKAAAPVFARTMPPVLRLLNVPPDPSLTAKST